MANITGTTGNDVINGTGSSDTLYGGRGDDIIRGHGADDNVYGGTDNDKLYGGDGDDVVSGSSGNDQLYGGKDDDLISGGLGNDKVYGDSGDDHVNGGLGNDFVYGGAGDDLVIGELGNDHVYGGDGCDTIFGDDTVPEGGVDKLYGGKGNDLFVFDNFHSGVGVGKRDIIMDFDRHDDQIDLRKLEGVTEKNVTISKVSERGCDDYYVVKIDTDNDRKFDMEIQVNSKITKSDLVFEGQTPHGCDDCGPKWSHCDDPKDFWSKIDWSDLKSWFSSSWNNYGSHKNNWDSFWDNGWSWNGPDWH